VLLPVPRALDQPAQVSSRHVFYLLAPPPPNVTRFPELQYYKLKPEVRDRNEVEIY